MEKLTKCPTCGSQKIKQVRRSWTGVFKGQRYTAPNVRFYECPDCGETVFDPDAVDKIEAYRPASSPARPPAKALPKLTKCPTCGSRKIKRVRRSWTSVYKGQRYTAPRVPFDECPDCGEKVLAPAAVRKIQAHRPGVSDALETAVKAGRC